MKTPNTKFPMLFKDKFERLEKAKARSLKISYEELKREFGDELTLLIHELGYVSGAGFAEVRSLMTQTFSGAILQSTGLSFEEIDNFFGFYIKAKPTNRIKYPEGSTAVAHRKLQAVWNPFAMEHGFRVIIDRFDAQISHHPPIHDISEEKQFMIVNAHNNGLIRWCKNGRIIFYKKRKDFGRIQIPAGTPIGFTPVDGVTNYEQAPNSCEKE